jgi:hypothetical protein
MREAVGVDGDTLEVGHVLLAQRALDRGARLAPVEDDRLIVEDAPPPQSSAIGWLRRKARTASLAARSRISI